MRKAAAEALAVADVGDAARLRPGDVAITYVTVGDISHRLLEALPDMLVLRADALETPLVALLDAEIARDDPGQEVVLDRLLDLLLIAVLRAWFSRPEAEAPTWYRALGDPVVGPVMRMLHNNPNIPGRSRRWRPRSASPAPPWPGASTSWSAIHPWRTSPASGWTSPPTCSSSRTPRSVR